MKKMILSGQEFKLIDANTFFKRLIGLMGRSDLEANEAMRLVPCSGIHTCFMKFAIDVVFLDKKNMVVGIIENLQPWKLNAYRKDAYQVVEMAAGSIEKSKIKKNMFVKFESGI